jgi:hypothetical protein
LIAQSRESFQHFFSIDGLEVFLLGLVRRGSERHLPFDHVDSSVSQADLIAGIDGGSVADSRSVGQIPIRHIGSVPDGGVEVARRVAKKRISPMPVLAIPVVLLKSAWRPLAVLKSPVVLF